MISKIKGLIIDKADRFIIVDTGGVGYKVYTTSTILNELKAGEESDLWTHLSVKETSLDIFGFKKREDLDFFELLITISGIGPKSALAILDISTTESLRRGVIEGDTTYLTKVSGIGKKMAEKIVIELKDKLGVGGEHRGSSEEEVEVIEALRSLGYSQEEARESLKKIPSSITGTGEKIKYALKHLSP